MVDIVFAAGRLAAALFLVGLNGFFVTSEFALVRLRQESVDRMVDEGYRAATLLQDITDDLDEYLAVTQLGITVASLALGWVGEPAVAALVEPLIGSFVPETAVHLVAVVIGFSVITFLHVVYGELAPKTLAIQRTDRVARIVAPPMKFFYYLFIPGIVVFNGTANYSTRLFGIQNASETDETRTEGEIRSIISDASAAGRVDDAEVEMIERVFDLDDTVVRKIMRPGPDVATVPAITTLPDLRTMVVEGEYTRYPVLDGDEVVGFVDVKDVLRTTESSVDDETVTARDLAREMVIVPETLTVDELLETFQDEQRQMAAVIDEWGAFEGLVTVEDVVEEVVGDIRDQFDLGEPAPSIDPGDNGEDVVDGELALSTLNDHLGTELESADFDTVGGFVLDHLGRAPEVGDTVQADGYRFSVADVDGTRVTSVLVQEHQPDPVPDGDRE